MGVGFDAEQATGDEGLPWRTETAPAHGLGAAQTGRVSDRRHGPVRSALVALVQQRVFPIDLGDQDQDDTDHVRGDPLLRLARGGPPAAAHPASSTPAVGVGGYPG
jgi:hypothetical protein